MLTHIFKAETRCVTTRRYVWADFLFSVLFFVRHTNTKLGNHRITQNNNSPHSFDLHMLAYRSGSNRL